jgi:hypothetical protein
MDPASARDLIDGMERAREILGEQNGPSPELESRASAAAEQLGVQLETRRVLDDLGFPLWQTGYRHPRGDVWVSVTATWEDAYRELGLL